MQPGGAALAAGYLDRLADAIVSLEYYIETLQAGRSDPWYMLDNAQACLDALAARAGAGRCRRCRRWSKARLRRRVQIAGPAAAAARAQMDAPRAIAAAAPPVLAAAKPRWRPGTPTRN